MDKAKEVARFINASGDERVVFLSQDERGVEVREEVSGHTAELVYGASTFSAGLVFEQEVICSLLYQVKRQSGCNSLDSYLKDPNHCLADLMDVCDRGGVAYGYTGAGADGSALFRPRPCEPAASL